MSKPRKEDSIPLIATTLGKETSFAGTLRFKDSLRIRGKFEGEIDAMGRLFIDSEAVVKAQHIRATSVVVGGTVHGDIEAADRLEMLSTAKVYGNVRTAKLRIADGVIFEGSCEMIRDPSSFNPFTSGGARGEAGGGGGRAVNSPETLDLAAAAACDLFAVCAAKGLKLACAESCTGGLISALLTDIPGSSRVLWGCIVAYSNDSKTQLLQVPSELLRRHGAVSREAARSMAAGALAKSDADLALAVTGVAGPDGGTRKKPVGLVWFAWASRNGESREESAHFAGERWSVRAAAAERALRGALGFATRIESEGAA